MSLPYTTILIQNDNRKFFKSCGLNNDSKNTTKTNPKNQYPIPSNNWDHIFINRQKHQNNIDFCI